VERGFASGTPGSAEYQVEAREVGESVFNITVFGRLSYRTLRALEFHNRREPGVPLGSTPGFTLSPPSRANPILSDRAGLDRNKLPLFIPQRIDMHDLEVATVIVAFVKPAG
jgi:hypothetical protein